MTFTPRWLRRLARATLFSLTLPLAAPAFAADGKTVTAASRAAERALLKGGHAVEGVLHLRANAKEGWVRATTPEGQQTLRFGANGTLLSIDGQAATDAAKRGRKANPLVTAARHLLALASGSPKHVAELSAARHDGVLQVLTTDGKNLTQRNDALSPTRVSRAAVKAGGAPLQDLLTQAFERLQAATPEVPLTSEAARAVRRYLRERTAFYEKGVPTAEAAKRQLRGARRRPDDAFLAVLSGAIAPEEFVVRGSLSTRNLTRLIAFGYVTPAIAAQALEARGQRLTYVDRTALEKALPATICTVEEARRVVLGGTYGEKKALVERGMVPAVVLEERLATPDLYNGERLLLKRALSHWRVHDRAHARKVLAKGSYLAKRELFASGLVPEDLVRQRLGRPISVLEEQLLVEQLVAQRPYALAAGTRVSSSVKKVELAKPAAAERPALVP
ncbi:MAG: hypothetical protein IT371_31275 [Deltaproteobacteria bacterium]|nr:hypothetical protein [Deltaproteobacteria bacterium]